MKRRLRIGLKNIKLGTPVVGAVEGGDPGQASRSILSVKKILRCNRLYIRWMNDNRRIFYRTAIAV